MSVLDRDALQASPLADLHALASELSLDGYRRLRKADLIDRILERQAGAESAAEDAAPGAAEDAAPDDDADGSAREGTRRRRGRRGGRGRGESATEAGEDGPSEEADEAPDAEEPKPARGGRTRTPKGDQPARSGSRRRGGEPRDRGDEPRERSSEPRERGGETEERGRDGEDEPVVEGVVELLPNGSGFVRVEPPAPSDDDVYISAAQVKRCELVSGDTVTGPRRAPRRSERFASLVRVDTINGTPAGELASGTRFDDLAAEFPTERIRLGSADPTVKAIAFLTPFGRGSRVTITGRSRAGKTEALRRLAAALGEQDELGVSLVLAGVRPEEISEWRAGEPAPAQALSIAASSDAQDQAVEQVVDQGRRIAARGGHAVVLIDTLDGLHPHAARKVMAAARNLTDGGSLTIIATASEPVGGETTVIALDAERVAAGRFPALDLARSGSLRPERLVGDTGAEAIAAARSEALDA